MNTSYFCTNTGKDKIRLYSNLCKPKFNCATGIRKMEKLLAQSCYLQCLVDLLNGFLLLKEGLLSIPDLSWDIIKLLLKIDKYLNYLSGLCNAMNMR